MVDTNWPDQALGDLSNNDVDNEKASQKPVTRPWRYRASPFQLDLAIAITALVLTAIGAIIEIVTSVLLSRVMDGYIVLGLWFAYLTVGVIYLVSQRNSVPDSLDSEPDNPLGWPFEVIGRVIRGRDRQRHLALQIIVWLLIGHFMVTGIAIYGVIEGIGSFGI